MSIHSKVMSCLLNFLNILANIVINKYFTNSCILLVTEKEINYVGTYPVVTIKATAVDEKIMTQALYFGCQNIVVQSEKADILIDRLEKQLKLSTQRLNHRKYFILLPDKMEEDIELYPSLHFVPSVLILVLNNFMDTKRNFIESCEVTFSFLTHKFVGSSQNDELYNLDIWFSKNESFMFENNLFPDKIKDLQGRVLRMATFSYKPYAIVGSTLDESDGTEMRIAKEYAKKHNGTLELVVDEEHEWGEIYDNWTGNGILGNIAMDKADMGFGALYTWYHEFAFLDLSFSVVRTGITCLAPAPRRLSGWLSPLFPFNLVLWATVIASFIISLCLYLFISFLNSRQRRSSDNDRVLKILLIIRIFLLQSFPNEKATNLEYLSVRYLIGSVLVLSLLIATGYNSGLVSSMTLPRYEKPISSVQDLSDSNIAWGATHEAWIFSIQSATQPTLVNVRNNFKILTESKLKSRTTTRDYAFSIERLPAGHFAIGSYISKADVLNLLLMKEDIYWEHCVFMTRKSSPFISSLNIQILRIHESGLPSVWETHVALKHLDYQVQLEVKLLSEQKHPDQEPVKLRVSHVEGIFFIWFIGLIIALLCFLFELIIYKSKNH